MSPHDTATAALHTVLAAASCHGQGKGNDCGGRQKFHVGNVQLIHFTGGQMSDVLFVALCVVAALAFYALVLRRSPRRR